MKRSLNYPPDLVASLSEAQLTEMLQLDLEVLLCYTPAALRAMITADRGLVGEIGKMLMCFARATENGFADGTPIFDDKQLWEREGFEEPLTDREFLRRMALVASWCADYCESRLVEGEVGYAAWQETVKAKAAAYAAKFDPIEQARIASDIEANEPRLGNAKKISARVAAARAADVQEPAPAAPAGLAQKKDRKSVV